jgi:hypothetical protein
MNGTLFLKKTYIVDWEKLQKCRENFPCSCRSGYPEKIQKEDRRKER